MAHGKDYIPTKDEDFDGWQSNLVIKLTAKLVALGLSNTAADYVDVTTKQVAWNIAFPIGRKSANPTHPQVITKQNSRHAFELSIRKYVKFNLAANPLITDTDRADLGITIPDTTRTRSHVPVYSPVGNVEKIANGLHILRILDPTYPDTKEMPDGALGAQVFVSVVPTPVTAVPTLESYHFVGLATKFEYEVPWSPVEVGKAAYYYVQYVDIHGETSARSSAFSAVIA